YFSRIPPIKVNANSKKSAFDQSAGVSAVCAKVSLYVQPTAWARAQGGGYLPGVAGWNELYARYWFNANYYYYVNGVLNKKRRGIPYNLGGLKDQHICHQQLAWWRPGEWHLDEARPDVSYAQTVNSFCNPGDDRRIID
ncbi:DUF2599 domain-containing protein, partial [Methyloglobulus sp.]|uniref:DUF2599 domain-containing protein n=1 Tax=Methyloglobulus sp. TaxID=2518622 RepID=UPI0032B83CC6